MVSRRRSRRRNVVEACPLVPWRQSKGKIERGQKEGFFSASGRRVDSSVSREACVQRDRRGDGLFQDESTGNRANR